MPSRFAVDIIAYVLMDNHYHLLLRPRTLNLSRAIQWLNVGHAVWFNRKYNRVGPLFQGRFKSILIGDEWRLTEISRYIHLNPARTLQNGLDKKTRKIKEKGMGLAPDEKNIRSALNCIDRYRWSSYRAYLGLEKPPAWLKFALVHSMDSDGYRQYVEESIRLGTPMDPWEEMVVEGYWGTKEKLDVLKKQIKGNRQEQKGLRQLEGLIKWEQITGVIEKVENKKWEELCSEYGNRGRDMGLVLGRRYGGMSLRELGENAGKIKYPAVSEAIRRLERQIKTDKKLSARLTRVEQLLNI